MPECSLLDPAPIEITPGTEIPFDIAVAIRREPVPFATLAGEQRGQREISREETRVAGRPAVRLEMENTEALLRPEGARSYRYFVDLGGETLVAATHNTGELPYEAIAAAILGIVVTSVYLAGLLERRKRVVLRMGWTRFWC